jgi:hypothetical protein
MEKENELVQYQEIGTIKKEVFAIESKAKDFKINSQKSFNESSDIIKLEIKEPLEKIKNFKDKWIKPLKDHVKEMESQIKPFEKALEEAKDIIRKKQVEYSDKLEEEAKKKEQEIENKIKEGEMSLEEAEKKIDRINDGKVSKGEESKTTFRIDKVLCIYDEEKIPRTFLIPDEKKIKEALKKGFDIPGAKLVDKKISINR